MPNNDIEVFEHLTADRDTPLEIDYFTFAIFALKKKKWIEHYKERNNGNAPSQADIDNWISQITDFDFGQMRNEAADYFHAAAEDHLEEYIEDQKKEAVKESILSEVESAMTKVKSFTSPWKHLGIALLMAVIAPVLLGGIFFFLGVFDRTFPVHVTVTPTEQTTVSPPKPTN
jgi:hypothetical protein